MSTASPVGGAEVTFLEPPNRPREQPRHWPFAVVAGCVLALAYEDGGYGLTARTILAIALWGPVILAVALGLVPRVRPSRVAVAVGGAFGAFALWSLASALWAPSPEAALREFDRNSLYLALYLVAIGTGGRRNLAWWREGLRLGIVATAVIALTSRLFPHLFPSRELATFIPNASSRLSFPVGYWNGLAILVALAVPLSFAAALTARTAWRRALALAPVPVVAAVILLTSSRGGVVAAVVGTAVFLAGSSRRWPAAGVVALGCAGSAVAVVILRLHPTLVNGPLGDGSAESQGRTVAALLLATAVLTAALLPAAEHLLYGRTSPPRRLGISLVALLFTLILLVAIAAHPVRRFDHFRQPPTAAATASPSFATAHLTSGNGSGRWQFWTSAVDEWKSAPLVGRGAGSYQFWWAQHASFTYFLKNAHSLYLEVLGELGAVGLLLLVGALGGGLVAAVGGLRRAVGAEREALAALTGVLAAFLVGAGIDWVWQLTVVGVVGIAALGLVTASSHGDAGVAGRPWPGGTGLALGAVALLAAWAAICAQAVPWLTAARIGDSQAAARRGNLAQALRDAQDARAVQPWASSPYLQLALVAEARGDMTAALRWIHAAISRDTADWTNWYVAARIEREAGHPVAARRAYARARFLNVRSPIFASRPSPP